MREVMAVVKALADEHRIRALMALQGRELCVCQIIELLGLAPSTVSKHMTILKQARLVEGRKDGRWMHYRLAESEATPAAREALAWMQSRLERNPVIREDSKRLRSIVKKEREELCRTQNRARAAREAREEQAES